MKKILLLMAALFCGIAVSAQDRTDSMHVAHYDIHLNITDFTNHQVYGYADLQVVAKVEGLDYVHLDLQRMTADSILLDGVPHTDFTHEGTLIHIGLPQPLASGDTVRIRVYYAGLPAIDSYFGGFYFSGEYCYNLGVAFRDLPHNFGRAWYPCMDFFTDKSTYTFHIETEAGKKAICGGVLTDSVATDDSTVIWSWVLDDPVPTYLTSVAVGNYMHYADTVQGLERVVPIDIYTRPSEFNKIAGSFVHLKDVFHLYESLYGPYPWVRLGYVGVAFTGGAMEHVTNIAYPQIAIGGTTANELLYAHEFSHMWFGDLVTCSRAEEMWINEGFARFNEAVADGGLYPNEDPAIDGYRTNIRATHHDVLRTAHIDDGGYWALDSMPQEVTYGTTTYDKGALVVHTLRNYMGDSVFFASLRAMFQTYAYQNITTMQLFDFLSEQSGMNLHDFREGWVSQPGFLHFAVDSIRATGNDDEYRFYVRQRLSHAYHFANSNVMDITFFSADNQRYTLERFSFSGEFAQGTVTLPWAPAFAVVDIDEKMTDAIIDYGYDLTATGIKNATDANFKLLVNDLSEPTYFRVEDNIIPAEPLSEDANPHVTAVSTDHYWRVACTPEGTIQGGMRFAFHANNESASDYHFLHDYTFNEVELLYRRDGTEQWRPVEANKTGNMTNGYLAVSEVIPGEYAIGVGDGVVGVNTVVPISDVRIYPNPASDKLTVEIDHASARGQFRVQVCGLDGKKLMDRKLSSRQSQIDVDSLPAGIYVVMVLSEGKMIFSQKFVKE